MRLIVALVLLALLAVFANAGGHDSSSSSSSSTPSSASQSTPSVGSSCESSSSSVPSSSPASSSPGSVSSGSASSSSSCASSSSSSSSEGSTAAGSSSEGSVGSTGSSSSCASSSPSSSPASSSQGSVSSGSSDSCDSSASSATASAGSSSQGSVSSGSCASSSSEGSTAAGSSSQGSVSSGSSDSCDSSSSSTTASAGSSSQGSIDYGTYCRPGTFSETGHQPCEDCANNTYANIGETECTPCPEFTHAPDGAASLTECTCDDGYTSLWASGGPCFPIGETPSYVYCGPGTYSETGSEPCTACPNNTYANIAETSCTACPEHTHAPNGAASLTECVCDDGYWSLWASGGPCYANGESAEESSTGGAATGGSEQSTGGFETNSTDCSSFTTACECKRQDGCKAIHGHSCTAGKWEFLGCISTEEHSSCLHKSTCAVNGDGERAWFRSRCLPDGWTSTSSNSKCGSCCEADNEPEPGTGGNNGTSGGVGTGCSFINGSACVLIEFEGTCPADALLNEWRIKVIEAIAKIVSSRRNVTKAQATIGLTVAAIPSTNTDGDTCAVHLQIFPPESTPLNANDFLMAIWEQLGGDSLVSDLPSSVAGVAAYRTYGSLAPLTDSPTDVVITSGASTVVPMVVSIAAVATLAVAAVF